MGLDLSAHSPALPMATYPAIHLRGGQRRRRHDQPRAKLMSRGQVTVLWTGHPAEE